MKGTAAVAALAMTLYGFPVAAFADSESTGTLDAGNGWSLEYTASGGSATITKVVAVGKGQATIPSSAGGATVTGIAAKTFLNQGTLTSVSLPNTLTDIEERAFAMSGLTSVELPSSLRYVPKQCFAYCSGLSKVSFDGSLQYIEDSAFLSCTSLAELTIPSLTGYAPSSSQYRIGNSAFKDCSKLKTITFLEGTQGGANNYFAGDSVVNGCSDDLTFVFYCAPDTKKRAFEYTYVSKCYIAVNFYNSESAASAGTGRTAQVLFDWDTKMSDIAAGKVDASQIYDGGAVPTCADGKAWGWFNHAFKHDGQTLQDALAATTEGSGSDIVSKYPDIVLNLVAVDADNIAYSYVYSPEIASNNDWENSSHPVSDQRPDYNYYLSPDGTGVEGIDNIVVYGPDGNLLDASKYTLKFEKQGDRDEATHERPWVAISGPEAITAEGSYRVRAVSGSSESPTATFYVENFSMHVSNYGSGSRSSMVGKALEEAAGNVSSAKATVVYPAGNWQNGLIAAGLAGSAGSVAVPVEKSGTSADALRAVNTAGSDKIITLGTSKEITSAVTKSLKELSVMRSEDGSVTGSITAVEYNGAQDMANKLYSLVVKYNKRLGFAYGDTAVVLSATDGYNMSLAAQYAYATKAAVFFADANGSLSSLTLSNLKDGGFTKIAVAGLSSAATAKIQSECNVEPVSIMDADGSLYEKSLASAKAHIDELGLKANKVVVASAADPSYVISAAQYASVKGAMLVVAASGVDLKSLQDYIDANVGRNKARMFALVGDFSKIDSKAFKRFNQYFNGTAMSTQIGVGDTYEVAGSLYKLTASGKAAYAQLLDKGLTSVTVGSVSINGSSCKVTAVGNGAFADCTALKTVNISSTALASIGSKAFSGCSSLKTLTIKSSKLKKAKVGANAFKNVSKKVTVKVPKAKLKAYKQIFKAKGLSSKATFKQA